MAARKFLSGLDLASQKIVNLADGTTASDGATWGQVQNLVAGLAWKEEVRVATTANGTLATAYANGSTVDGVTLATGDRILIKNQTTQTENGIYTVNASGAPTRATDADSTTDLNNATVSVVDGTANTGTAWIQTTKNPVVGTNNIVFGQFAAGGVTYTASATGGLQVAANAFSVKLPASSGLIADATGLYIDSAIVVRKYAVDVGNGALTAIPVTHGLGTRDCQVTVFDNTTFAEVGVDVVHTSTTVVTLNFATAPAAAAYRVVVQA